MDSKTIETQKLLTLVAERMGILQLKLKNSIHLDDGGVEHERLMRIADSVRGLLEEMVDAEDKEVFEDKAKIAFEHTGSI